MGYDIGCINSSDVTDSQIIGSYIAYFTHTHSNVTIWDVTYCGTCWSTCDNLASIVVAYWDCDNWDASIGVGNAGMTLSHIVNTTIKDRDGDHIITGSMEIIGSIDCCGIAESDIISSKITNFSIHDSDIAVGDISDSVTIRSAYDFNCSIVSTIWLFDNWDANRIVCYYWTAWSNILSASIELRDISQNTIAIGILKVSSIYSSDMASGDIEESVIA